MTDDWRLERVAWTFIGLAAGLEMPQIARICNIAGGQVCEVLGVVAVDARKLEAEVMTDFLPGS